MSGREQRQNESLDKRKSKVEKIKQWAVTVQVSAIPLLTSLSSAKTSSKGESDARRSWIGFYPKKIDVEDKTARGVGR